MKFTEEEVLYIEKIMDINASICGDKLVKTIELFMLAKSLSKEHTNLLSKQLTELGDAYLITKSIRNKIEESRLKGGKK